MEHLISVYDKALAYKITALLDANDIARNIIEKQDEIGRAYQVKNYEAIEILVPKEQLQLAHQLLEKIQTEEDAEQELTKFGAKFTPFRISIPFLIILSIIFYFLTHSLKLIFTPIIGLVEIPFLQSLLSFFIEIFDVLIGLTIILAKSNYNDEDGHRLLLFHHETRLGMSILICFRVIWVYIQYHISFVSLSYSVLMMKYSFFYLY